MTDRRRQIKAQPILQLIYIYIVKKLLINRINYCSKESMGSNYFAKRGNQIAVIYKFTYTFIMPVLVKGGKKYPITTEFSTIPLGV